MPLLAAVLHEALAAGLSASTVVRARFRVAFDPRVYARRKPRSLQHRRSPQPLGAQSSRASGPSGRRDEPSPAAARAARATRCRTARSSSWINCATGTLAARFYARPGGALLFESPQAGPQYAAAVITISGYLVPADSPSLAP